MRYGSSCRNRDPEHAYVLRVFVTSSFARRIDLIVESRIANMHFTRCYADDWPYSVIRYNGFCRSRTLSRPTVLSVHLLDLEQVHTRSHDIIVELIQRRGSSQLWTRYR